MPTSPRFKFTATLVVSVLAVVLTLFVPGEDEVAGSAVHTAGLLPPPQR
ncbi:MAG TPA: hypothetical protein VIN03_27245 [Roseateles sp.]